MSSACQLAGIASFGTTLRSASFLKSLATTQSTGSRKFTLFFFTSARIWPASSTLSASRSDFPISNPCALKKVYAMPPPMIKVSTFDKRFCITSILPEIFAPPRIAVNGRTGLSTAAPRYSSSFCINKPATETEINFVTPSVDAWAR